MGQKLRHLARKLGRTACAAILLASCKPVSQVEAPSKAKPTPPVRHVAAKAVTEPIKHIPQPETSKSLQQERWTRAKIKPQFSIAVDKSVMLYQRTKDRYEREQKMRSNGVPAPVIFGLHMRESDNSFTRHLHEGSSLSARTRYVPKGRLPNKPPPYDWEESAEDAIYVADRLQGDWWALTWSLDKIEGYNGMGYRKLGIPSPYLFSGTTEYDRGKYTGDGHFSPTAVDQQTGVVAVLKRMQERGIPIQFAP